MRPIALCQLVYFHPIPACLYIYINTYIYPACLFPPYASIALPMAPVAPWPFCVPIRPPFSIPRPHSVLAACSISRRRHVMVWSGTLLVPPSFAGQAQERNGVHAQSVWDDSCIGDETASSFDLHLQLSAFASACHTFTCLHCI